MPSLRPWHFTALLWALGCSEATGAAGHPSAAETYLLESVDGCRPGLEARQCFPRPSWVVDGTMVLADDGRVTRTVRYQFPSDANPVTRVATGTYSRVGNFVTFALREGAGPASHVWRPRAFLSDEALILRYPHPADGEIVEVFARR
jgi:hypothetical protein